jgi:hypothetical protein
MTVIRKGAQHVMKVAEFIGHEIKENTELAEHERVLIISRKSQSPHLIKLKI